MVEVLLNSYSETQRDILRKQGLPPRGLNTQSTINEMALRRDLSALDGLDNSSI